MKQQLLPYQERAIQGLRRSIAAGNKRVLLQLPTGAGKTTVAAAIAESGASRGGATWMVVHRRELVRQAVARMEGQGLLTGIIQAGAAPSPLAQVHVVSIDTFATRSKRGVDFGEPPRRVIADEAHHSVAPVWDPLFAFAPDAVYVGLSATPWREDGSGLAPRWQDVVVGPSPRELVDQGRLVPVRVYASGEEAPKKGWDDGMVSELVGDVVGCYQRHAPGRRAICFAASVRHSLSIVESFRAAGIPAAHVDDKTKPDARDQAFADLASGAISVLSNVGIAGEGVDVPVCDAVILARDGKSESLYVQMVGRGLRSAPGKSDCVIIDHGRNVARFGDPLMHRPARIDGRPKKAQGRKGALCPWRVCDACLKCSPKKEHICVHCQQDMRAPPPDMRTAALKAVVPGAPQQAGDRTAEWKSLDQGFRALGRNPWAACYAWVERHGVMPHEDPQIRWSQRDRVIYFAARRKRTG